jgi:protein CpxP
MFRRFHIFTLSALVVIAAGGAMASAQGAGPGGPRGGGPGIGRGGPGGGLPLRELGLTDAQRDQVQQLTQQHREQTRALFERARAARQAQRQAMDAVPFNEQQIRAAMQAVAEAETELAVQQARLQSDIHALLTPAQQQAAQKMRADREARMKERRSR